MRSGFEQRLRSYLSQLKAVKGSPAAPEGELGERLPKLLSLFRRLGSVQDRTPGPARPLSPGNFRTTMLGIGEALTIAREKGAFLNVWDVAGLGRNEVRNAAVLAWFLDPKETHGLGTGFLEPFLQRALGSARDRLPPERELVRASVRKEFRPQGSETDRVDIAIEGIDYLVFIETKIDAREGHFQLERYAAAARSIGKRGGLLYLSPKMPRDLPAQAHRTSWADVAYCLRRAATRTYSPLVRTLILQFADHVSAFKGEQ